jgi:hypothetical protein
LHAYNLAFVHPESKDKMELYAPLPQDMKSIIDENFGKDIITYGTKK